MAHGPKPRDFSTELPKKMYHKAWRMALSYRYRRGQLVVVDELGVPKGMEKDRHEYWIRWALDGLGWGKGSGEHAFFITDGDNAFSRALGLCEKYGRVRSAEEVDVKNLLEMKRLVVERKALLRMLREHQSDLRMPLIKHPKLQNATPSINPLSATMLAGNPAQPALDTGFAGPAGAAAALAGVSSGLNDLSMEEADRLAADAERALAEEEHFDPEEEDFIADEDYEEEELEEMLDPVEEEPRR